MERQAKPNRNITLLGTAHSLNHSLFVITPPLLSLILASLGVTKFEIGLVSTIASMIYGAGALLGGPLGDRIGEIKAITICLALSGLTAPLMLLAGFMSEFYVYAATLTLMAFWASFYHPIANSFISKAFKVRVSEAMGLHGVGGTLGLVLTPTVAWFLGASFGWPWAFVFFGALSVLFAMLFARRAVATEEVSHSSTTIFDALRIRELRAVMILSIAIGLLKAVELFFPTYLKENRGVEPVWASVAYTVLLAFGVPGQWIGGKTASVIGSKKTLIGTCAAICVSLLFLLFLPIFVGMAIFIALYGLFFNAHQPALSALTGALSPYEQRGAVFGIFFFTFFGIGSVSQLIAGYVADVYGLDVAFYLLTIFAAVALFLCFRLPEERKSV
ncbi:MAG: MFS transporter [Candidatus Bathyarchaeota archaeon]|nr:MFS transporter [Candidatus Bathyarchaeota archaeon]